jgi:hypothetical protein
MLLDMNTTPRLLVIAAALGMAACAAPASVEGVFSGDGFELHCDSPLSKVNESGRDRVVVMSDHDTETLRAVNVNLKHVAELPLGQLIEVGTGARDDERPVVDVVVGKLVIDTRDDGVEILSSEDPTQATSVAGSLTIDERDDDVIAGSFHVDLDDGGYLEGSFVAPVR